MVTRFEQEKREAHEIQKQEQVVEQALNALIRRLNTLRRKRFSRGYTNQTQQLPNLTTLFEILGMFEKITRLANDRGELE